ncbi:zinc-ribbon domain-containing protein [Sphingomonas quercus]|uniref:Zinc-ribbon domain-containing protein n=1 Tax=Sphingomonas quercus TaxID=2842451 RepID=A0ABS6BF99_9SPHN|nr:zinc-ribbon domain-containing protein [Sphingomonas quercus]MBU3076979.1 zinc-ribbon domain-containing protein [Sphingomonas quercus]
MIISCPECGTRYDVPEAAIGASGRKLKCAACGNRWHIDGITAADQAGAPPEPAGAAPSVVAERPHSPVASREVPPPAHPSAPPLPVAPAVPPPPPPAGLVAEAEAADAGPSPFDYQPPFEPRPRSALKWLLWLLVAVLVLGAAAFFAVRANVGGVGDRLSRAEAATGSPLVISFTSTPERRPMDSGNELLSVAGRVTNPTSKPVRVPDIRAELRDAQGRAVYNWTIGAPVTRLAPGASADFNSAEVDVPQAARTIHLKPGPAPQV